MCLCPTAWRDWKCIHIHASQSSWSCAWHSWSHASLQPCIPQSNEWYRGDTEVRLAFRLWGEVTCRKGAASHIIDMVWLAWLSQEERGILLVQMISMPSQKVVHPCIHTSMYSYSSASMHTCIHAAMQLCINASMHTCSHTPVHH
jgi:hypothetical protein